VLLDLALRLAEALDETLALDADLEPAARPRRAVRPETVRITQDGRVVLSDLGVLLDAPAPEPVTLTGRSFRAPELDGAGETTPQGHVFALGALLAQMATGTIPSTAAVKSGAFAASLDDALPGLGTLIQQCLSANPAERPQSPADLQRELARLRVGVTIPSGALRDAVRAAMDRAGIARQARSASSIPSLPAVAPVPAPSAASLPGEDAPSFPIAPAMPAAAPGHAPVVVPPHPGRHTGSAAAARPPPGVSVERVPDPPPARAAASGEQRAGAPDPEQIGPGREHFHAQAKDPKALERARRRFRQETERRAQNERASAGFLLVMVLFAVVAVGWILMTQRGRGNAEADDGGVERPREDRGREAGERRPREARAADATVAAPSLPAPAPDPDPVARPDESELVAESPKSGASSALLVAATNLGQPLGNPARVFVYAQGADRSRATPLAEGTAGDPLPLPPGRYDARVYWEPAGAPVGFWAEKVLMGLDLRGQTTLQREADLNLRMATVRVDLRDGDRDVSHRGSLRVFAPGADPDAVEPVVDDDAGLDLVVPAGTWEFLIRFTPDAGPAREERLGPVPLRHGAHWLQTFDVGAPSWQPMPAIDGGR
jgi:hypothetical protein